MNNFKNTTIYLGLILFSGISVWAQSGWSGTFEGVVNGDPAVMTLTSNGKTLSGTLKDSYQTYNINGEVSGNRMAGDAVEQSLGLTMTILGELKGSEAHMKLIVSFLGQNSETPFVLTRAGKTAQSSKSQTSTPIVNGKRDPQVVGTWTKNETYNSGYGDQFMGANFSQSMTFLANGQLAEGGSSASISGSNYSGRSSSGSGNMLEGVSWYTEGKNIYLNMVQNGKAQNVLLGRYYIENGKMLITGQDGTKLLLIKN